MPQSTRSTFKQSEFDIRCEWGVEGLRRVAIGCKAIIIVDVLSFCTAVDIAVAGGASVYPYRYKDETAVAFAAQQDAVLAERDRRVGGFSLSPESLILIPRGTRLVLPSPNGSSLAAAAAEEAETDTPVFAACLRNAAAVARAAERFGAPICVVPAGETWDNQSLRPALEDFIGAGAVINHLRGSLSLEAEAAWTCFERFKDMLMETFNVCSSGKELNERGCSLDVELAAALNTSACVPVLQNGAFVDLLTVH